MKCSECNFSNPTGTKFCRKCGAKLDISPKDDGSVQSSLSALGIPLSARRIKGLVLAVGAGFFVPYIIPYIYAPILGTLQTVFSDYFLTLSISQRDSFNIFAMTALTFLTSFVISYISFRKE